MRGGFERRSILRATDAGAVPDSWRCSFAPSRALRCGFVLGSLKPAGSECRPASEEVLREEARMSGDGAGCRRGCPGRLVAPLPPLFAHGNGPLSRTIAMATSRQSLPFRIQSRSLTKPASGSRCDHRRQEAGWQAVAPGTPFHPTTETYLSHQAEKFFICWCQIRRVRCGYLLECARWPVWCRHPGRLHTVETAMP